MFLGAGDFDKAIQLYTQALKLQPDNAEALNQRCGARAAAGEMKAALEDCNAALTLKPGNASALDHRGMAYLKLGHAGSGDGRLRRGVEDRAERAGSRCTAAASPS